MMHLTKALAMNTIMIDTEVVTRMRAEGKEFLLLFTARWCGYCAALRKELEDSPPSFTLYEIDISDEESPTWDDYKIEVVPTVIHFKDGNERARKEASFSGLKVKEIQLLGHPP